MIDRLYQAPNDEALTPPHHGHHDDDDDYDDLAEVKLSHQTCPIVV